MVRGNDIATFDIWIAQHIGKFYRIHRDDFFGAREIDAVAGDKVVDQVKLAGGFSIQFGNDAVNNFD